jgi:hypothetical protein
MTCSKCKGLMVTARSSDFYQLFCECRCINCGAMVFPPIAGPSHAGQVRSHRGIPSAQLSTH